MKLNKEKYLNIIKKVLIGNGILIAILIILLIGMMSVDKTRTKIIIDGKEMQGAEALIKDINGIRYADLKGLLNGFYRMYKINNGIYGKKNEDPKYFYLESPYEAVQFEIDTNNMNKSIIFDYQDRVFDKKTGKVALLDDEKEKGAPEKKREKTAIDEGILSKETFSLKNNVIRDNGREYISVEDLKYALNVKVRTKGKTIGLYTIDYLEGLVAREINNNNYEVSNLYQNRRAIVDDYIVVKSASKYGMLFKNGSEFQSAISNQYDDIRFSQSDKNVYYVSKDQLGLKNLETKKDIITADTYEAIDVYAQSQGLYLVKREGKYGIIRNDGKVIVPNEFSQIGLDKNDEVFDDRLDKKILMDRFIPVKEKRSLSTYWTLYTIEGEKTGLYFKSIGYKVPMLVKPNASGMIDIPEEVSEKARELGIYNLRKEDKEKLDMLNLTLDSKDVPEYAKDTLYIPKEYKRSGVVVEFYDLIDKAGRYGVLSYDFKKNNPYSYPPTALRIFKRVKDGKEEYIAQKVSGVEDKFEKK